MSGRPDPNRFAVPLVDCLGHHFSLLILIFKKRVKRKYCPFPNTDATMIKIRNYVDVDFHVSFWRHFVKTLLTLGYLYIRDIFFRSAETLN